MSFNLEDYLRAKDHMHNKLDPNSSLIGNETPLGRNSIEKNNDRTLSTKKACMHISITSDSKLKDLENRFRKDYPMNYKGKKSKKY